MRWRDEYQINRSIFYEEMNVVLPDEPLKMGWKYYEQIAGFPIVGGTGGANISTPCGGKHFFCGGNDDVDWGEEEEISQQALYMT